MGPDTYSTCKSTRAHVLPVYGAVEMTVSAAAAAGAAAAAVVEVAVGVLQRNFIHKFRREELINNFPNRKRWHYVTGACCDAHDSRLVVIPCNLFDLKHLHQVLFVWAVPVYIKVVGT